MTAVEAFDENGVQYYFDANDVQGGHDSGWIDTLAYTDIDLLPNTLYCYRVKARDLSAGLNETEFSQWVCVRTQVPGDTTTPQPSPMAFDPNGLPAEFDQDGNANTWNDYAVEMLAVTATDDSGFVEYEFQCDTPEFSSGWQADPLYTTVTIGRWNQGLRFRVRARDASGNVTGWSDWVMAVIRPDQASLQPTTGGAAGGGVVATP
jgi:hypothetical protein